MYSAIHSILKSCRFPDFPSYFHASFYILTFLKNRQNNRNTKISNDGHMSPPEVQINLVLFEAAAFTLRNIYMFKKYFYNQLLKVTPVFQANA